MDGWDELIPALLKDRGDLVAGGFTATDTRRRQIAFTAETFPTRSVVITRGRTVASLADLKREKVGTIRGSSMIEDLAAAGVPASAVDADIESGQLLAALKSGTRDGGRRRHRGGARREGARPRSSRSGRSWDSRRRSPGACASRRRALRAALDEYIANARRTPTWNRLAVKYFGPAAPRSSGTRPASRCPASSTRCPRRSCTCTSRAPSRPRRCGRSPRATPVALPVGIARGAAGALRLQGLRHVPDALAGHVPLPPARRRTTSRWWTRSWRTARARTSATSRRTSRPTTTSASGSAASARSTSSRAASRRAGAGGRAGRAAHPRHPQRVGAGERPLHRGAARGDREPAGGRDRPGRAGGRLPAHAGRALLRPGAPRRLSPRSRTRARPAGPSTCGRRWSSSACGACSTACARSRTRRSCASWPSAQVCCDVALTSNTFLTPYRDLAAHPIRALLAAGVPVTLSTDDPPFFGTDLVPRVRARARRRPGSRRPSCGRST